MGLPSDGDDRPVEVGDQRPIELNTTDYVDLGGVNVGLGPDNLPVIEPTTRSPGLGLFVDSFVCNEVPAHTDGEGTEHAARAQCRHLAQQILDHPGDYSGVEGQERPKQIRRWCLRIVAQTEITDLTNQNVWACDLRDPADTMSGDLIAGFEERQRAQAIQNRTKSKTFEV